MPTFTGTLGDLGRRALRSALRQRQDHNALIMPPGFSVRAADWDIATAKNADLIEVAEENGLDVAHIVQTGQANAAAQATFQPITKPDAPEEAAPAVDTAQTAAPARIITEDRQAPEADAVEAMVRDVLAPMGSGDMMGFQQRLRALASSAASPVVRTVEVEKVVERVITKTITKAPAPEGCEPKHFASVIRQETAGKLMKGGKGLSKVSLDIWNDPDAPQVDSDYIWPDSTFAVLTQIKRQRNPFLWGPRGCGKSSFAEQFAAVTGRGFSLIQCTDQTEAAVLVGLRTPQGWRDGILTQAIRKPGQVVLIDELTVARPGALFVFQTVLQQRYLFIEETGERVEVAPGVVFFAADNTAGFGDEQGDYEGTRRMNGASRDRLGVSVPFTYMKPAQEIKVLQAKTGCAADIATKLVNFATITRRDTATGKMTHGVGIRRLMSWAEMLSDGVSDGEAFDLAIYWHTAPDDREHVRQLYKAEWAGLGNLDADALAGFTPDSNVQF